MFDPVHTRRTFEEAAEQIAEKVRTGELRPGDRLPGERSLAIQMEISRPTLREAIRVLVDAGVVDVTTGPGGGMTVATDVVPVDLVRPRGSNGMRIGEVASVLEARRLLEPRVARLAAVRATQRDFAAMARSIRAMQDLLDRGGLLGSGVEPQDQRARERARHAHDRFLQLDVQFHLALARATGNPTLEGLVRQLFRRLEAARDVAVEQPFVPEWVIDVHERTLGAVQSGDPDEIDVVMDEHLGQLEKTWDEAVERATALA